MNVFERSLSTQSDTGSATGEMNSNDAFSLPKRRQVVFTARYCSLNTSNGPQVRRLHNARGHSGLCASTKISHHVFQLHTSADVTWTEIQRGARIALKPTYVQLFLGRKLVSGCGKFKVCSSCSHEVRGELREREVIDTIVCVGGVEVWQGRRQSMIDENPKSCSLLRLSERYGVMALDPD